MEKAIFDDCRKLINNFEKEAIETGFKFTTFAQVWKEFKLYGLFSVLTNDNEIISTVQCIMYIGKHILRVRKDNTEVQRIGGLYLLYTIYFKHEEYLKIELTPSQWKEIKTFIDSLPDEGDYLDAKDIFAKLIEANAFRFVLSDVYWALEEFFNPYVLQSNKSKWSTVEFQTARGILSKDLHEITRENGFLAALQGLEEGYHEMKESINIEQASKKICQNLLEGFKKIQDIIDGKVVNTEMEEPPSESSQMASSRRAIKQRAYES